MIGSIWNERMTPVESAGSKLNRPVGRNRRGPTRGKHNERHTSQHSHRVAVAGIIAMPVIANADGVLNVGSYPVINSHLEFARTRRGVFEGSEIDIVTEAAKRISMTVAAS